MFLLGGTFKIGGDEKTEAGIGYVLHDERTIQLQGGTVVALINED